MTSAEAVERLRDLFEVRPVRERLLILATAAACVFAAVDWSAGAWARARLADAQRTRANLEARIRAEESAAEQIAGAWADSPARRLDTRIEAALARLRALDDGVARSVAPLVHPDALPAALVEMLSGAEGLTVRSLETGAPRPLAVEGVEDPGAVEHPVTLAFDATWPALERYLASLEAAPRRVLWRRLHFELDAWPKALVELEIASVAPESAPSGSAGGTP
mgnify:CR=1 FL=1